MWHLCQHVGQAAGPLDGPIQGGPTDPKGFRDSSGGFAGVEQSFGHRVLGFVHDSLPATKATTGASGCQSGLYPFANEFPFYQGDCRHNVEKEASSRCARVDAIAQTRELFIPRLQLLNKVDKALHHPAQAVKFPDNQGVIRAEGRWFRLPLVTFNIKLGYPKIGFKLLTVELHD